MFLCNSWYLKRQHKKKQNFNSNSTLGNQNEPWPMKPRSHRRTKALQMAALQMQQAERDVAQSESAWKSVLKKGLPETPSTSTTASCYSVYGADSSKQDRKIGDKEADIEEHRALVKTSHHQLPPRGFLLVKELRLRRRLSDLSFDRPHLPHWKSTVLENKDLVGAKSLYQSSPNLSSWTNPEEPASVSEQPAVTESEKDAECTITAPVISTDQSSPPANRLIMPPWFQDFREQSFLPSRRKKETAYNWATAQVFQMHYEVRELTGKRFNKKYCNLAIFDWPE